MLVLNVCMSVYGYMDVDRFCQRPKEGMRLTDDCELSNIGSVNQIQVLSKESTLS